MAAQLANPSALWLEKSSEFLWAREAVKAPEMAIRLMKLSALWLENSSRFLWTRGPAKGLVTAVRLAKPSALWLEDVFVFLVQDDGSLVKMKAAVIVLGLGLPYELQDKLAVWCFRFLMTGQTRVHLFQAETVEESSKSDSVELSTAGCLQAPKSLRVGKAKKCWLVLVSQHCLWTVLLCESRMDR